MPLIFLGYTARLYKIETPIKVYILVLLSVQTWGVVYISFALGLKLPILEVDQCLSLESLGRVTHLLFHIIWKEANHEYLWSQHLSHSIKIKDQ